MQSATTTPGPCPDTPKVHPSPQRSQYVRCLHILLRMPNSQRKTYTTGALRWVLALLRVSLEREQYVPGIAIGKPGKGLAWRICRACLGASLVQHFHLDLNQARLFGCAPNSALLLPKLFH